MAVTIYDGLVVSPDIYNGGSTFYVSSVTGNSGNDGSYGHPLTTIELAEAKCTANKGDVIALLPNHAETISAAAGIALATAGISVVGMGNGDDRATITFDTLTTADLDVTAAGITFKNVVFVGNKDALANPLNISAADCTFENCEFRDTSSTIEAARYILTTADADRLRVINCLFSGQTGGNACVNGIRLVGGNEVLIQDCRFLGKASTAWVEFHTTACSGVNVVDCIFEVDGTTDFSKTVVDTATGSKWSCKGFDVGAGASFSGGSGAALAGDDVSAVSTAVTSVGTQVTSVGTQAGSLGTQATSVGTLVTSVGTATNTETASVGTLVTSVGTATNTETASVGTLTTSVGTQATSLGTQSGSVGTQTTSVGTLVSSVGTQATTIDNWGVRTVLKSSLALDGGSVADVFAVANGPIELLGLISHLTEAVSANACNFKWESDPTVGAGNADICGNVDINAAAIGDQLFITGTSADAMVKAANGTAVGRMCDNSAVVFPGGIDATLANADPTSGIADVYLTYRPLTSTSTVTAP